MSIVLVGSTSGSITLQEPAVAGSTVLTLPAVTGTVLTDTSPKAGNVIQVVNATTSTVTSSSSATYADTGLTATITPTSATSKILVLVDQNGVGKNASSTIGVDIRLQRSGSTIVNMNFYAAYTGTAIQNNVGSVSTNYLDSPATTSAVTYKTQFANPGATSLVFVQNSGETSTITLLEIAA
jgi:hypothetical protein